MSLAVEQVASLIGMLTLYKLLVKSSFTNFILNLL